MHSSVLAEGTEGRIVSFSLLIRILQRPLSETEMRRSDERRGSGGGPEIDQNQTGGQSTGGHGEGRNVGPARLATLNGAV